MEITTLTFRLLLLFFPGIVCTLLYETLTTGDARKPFKFLLLSFVLGMSCYATLFVLEYLWLIISDWTFSAAPDLEFLTSLAGDRPTIPFVETLWATLLAFPASLLLTFVHKHKLLYRLARIMQISRKHGDLGIWDFAFTSDMPEWVVVRDTENDLAYDGWVRAFSDTVENNELLLQDVRVCEDSSGKELYTCGAVYLSFEGRSAIIEFAGIEYKPRKESEEHARGE